MPKPSKIRAKGDFALATRLNRIESVFAVMCKTVKIEVAAAL